MPTFKRSRVIEPAIQERLAIGLSTAALVSVTGLMVLIALDLSATHDTPNPGQIRREVAATVAESSTVNGADNRVGRDTDATQAAASKSPVSTGDNPIAAGRVNPEMHSGARRSPEQAFKAMLPRLAQADRERRAACEGLARVVVSKLVSLDHQPIPQELVDTITSLGSKASYMADEAGHRRWIASQFANQVLSADDLATIVRSALNEFQAKLVDIDNRLLVDLRADIELDPTSMTLPPLDFAPVEQRILQLQSSLHDELSASIQGDLASFFASLVAGEASTMGARALMADENGELDAGQEIAAWLTGFLVGAVADVVISEAMSVDDDIVARCREARISIITQVMPAHDEGKLWYIPACKHAWDHRNQVLWGIIAQLSLDADWAIAEYKSYAAVSEEQ